jgi:hypothetical protein
MRLTCLALSILALAACQPGTDKAKAAANADARTQAEAKAEAPAAAPAADGQPQLVSQAVSFDPLSKTAESVTGALSLSILPPSTPDAPPMTRMTASNGSVYETALVPGGAETARDVDWSSIFSTRISFEPNAPADVPSVDLHAVKSETIAPKAPNGGFCGKEKTGFLAMAIPITLPGGGLAMSIAAFKGDAWPPKDATALCGVYTYNTPH